MSVKLPVPQGPHPVAFLDLMTPGLPSSSLFLRLHYPTILTSSSCPLRPWTDTTSRSALTNFVQFMTLDKWPSWVNNQEFLALPLVTNLLNTTSFPLAFNLGWNLMGSRLSAPLVEGGPLATREGDEPWPVVVFSHGMGCDRTNMAQVCYQLASQGVVVVAVEHREGSSSLSCYKETREGEVVLVQHQPLSGGEWEMRNRQVNLRGSEICRTVRLLENINRGNCVENVLTEETSGSQDLRFLTHRLDMEKNLFLMGHSFGGSSVFLAANLMSQNSSSPPLAGVVGLDPWMFPLAKQPILLPSSLEVLVLNTEAFLHPLNLEIIRGAGGQLEEGVLEGAVHLSATDMPRMLTSTVARQAVGFEGNRKAEKVMEAINQRVWRWIGARIK